MPFNQNEAAYVDVEIDTQQPGLVEVLGIITHRDLLIRLIQIYNGFDPDILPKAFPIPKIVHILQHHYPYNGEPGDQQDWLFNLELNLNWLNSDQLIQFVNEFSVKYNYFI